MENSLTSLMFRSTEGLFFVLLLLYTIHGVFLGYHWFKYGTSREISLIALATYLVGGAVLFLTLSLALNVL